jgi:hypothetical protein
MNSKIKRPRTSENEAAINRAKAALAKALSRPQFKDGVQKQRDAIKANRDARKRA